jgi:hypothetical protein
MIGLTIMEISAEQMQGIVQWYLNNNLLNVTFQKHHESVVENVKQRSNGRFVIEFVAKNAERPKAEAVSPSRPSIETNGVDGDIVTRDSAQAVGVGGD